MWKSSETSDVSRRWRGVSFFVNQFKGVVGGLKIEKWDWTEASTRFTRLYLLFFTAALEHVKFLKPPHYSAPSVSSLEEDTPHREAKLMKEKARDSPRTRSWAAPLEMQTRPPTPALLTFHGWVAWRLMSHTWRKVLPRGETASRRIPAHPASVWTTSPSPSYGRSSHGRFTRRGEQQGEMENQLLSGIFFIPSNIPMLAVMCRQIRGRRRRKNWGAQSDNAAASWEVC